MAGMMFSGAAQQVNNSAQQSQSSNPYGDNYRPPTGSQGTPAGPTTPKAGAAPIETDEERRRRQALILGATYEGLGEGGRGASGGGDAGTGGGTGSSSGGGGGGGGTGGGDGTGGGTGGTY